MRRAQNLLVHRGGFTFTELVIVIALLLIVTVMSVPWLIGFVRAERTRGAAREVMTLLNQARQLAITRNTRFSMETQTTPQDRVRFCAGSVTPCPGGAVWVGPGTDANGWIRMANGDRITLGPQITFSPLGAADTAGTLRVQDGQGISCLDVMVSVSGRIRITAAGACP